MVQRDYIPVYAQAGDRIVLDVRGGQDETLAWDTTVSEPCDSGDNGYWYCDTCRKQEFHNIGIDKHAAQEHRLVWICYEHGPETVR